MTEIQGTWGVAFDSIIPGISPARGWGALDSDHILTPDGETVEIKAIFIISRGGMLRLQLAHGTPAHQFPARITVTGKDQAASFSNPGPLNRVGTGDARDYSLSGAPLSGMVGQEMRIAFSWDEAHEAQQPPVVQQPSEAQHSAVDIPDALRQKIANTRRLHSREDVVAALRGSVLSHLQPFLCGDGTLTSLPRDVWMDFIEWSDVDRVKYVTNARTCSNFALALAGQAALRAGVDGCGIVVDASGGHAYCCLLVHDESGALSILLIEPQSDRIPQIGDTLSGHEAYKAESGCVLFA